jgi:hypothetical protein
VESVDLTFPVIPGRTKCEPGMTAWNWNYLDASAASLYQHAPMINVSTILIARRRRTIAVRAVDRV